MFFNIYSVFMIFFRLSLSFLFFLKYLFPFFYSTLVSYSNFNTSNINKLVRVNNYKSLINSKILTLFSREFRFNTFYQTTLSINPSLERSLLNWFVFKKIYNSNALNLKINEVVFTYTYLNLLYTKYINVFLLSDKGFFNFQKANQTVKSSNVIRRFNNSSNTKELNNNLKKSNQALINNISSVIKNTYVNIKSIYQNWAIRFNSTSIDKLLSPSTNYNILFIRNFKVFNKGRYSRNRQYYRTGVYWCLYINIIAVVGMYYWFYRFTMNFGYLWWLFYSFFIFFVFLRFILFNLIYKNNIANLNFLKTYSKFNSIFLSIYFSIYNLIF